MLLRHSMPNKAQIALVVAHLNHAHFWLSKSFSLAVEEQYLCTIITKIFVAYLGLFVTFLSALLEA